MGKRLALIGAGAMGGQAGAKLTAAGEDIVLIDPWKANVEAMRQRGITIQYRDQVFHSPNVQVLHATEVNRLREPIDILFVFVKSFDTEWAVKLVLPYLSADCWVVSLQNCINEYLIEPLVGARHVMGGVLMANGQMIEPGMITSYSPALSETDSQQLALTVGELMNHATYRAREVARLLNSTWPATTTDNLLEERWNKMVVNCMGNALCGITGLTTREGLQHPECRRLMIRLGAESIRVIWALGFTVHTIYLGNFTPEECIANSDGQSDAADRGLEAWAEKVHPAAKRSLMQDVLRDRPTEVDHLNGLVVRKGQEVGIATPLNEIMVDLVHQVERGKFRPSIAALARVWALL